LSKTTLADRLEKKQEHIREAYSRGKRTYTFEGVKFKLRRCGPENNYLAVSPASKGRVTPVLNFPYSRRKHDERMELKRSINQPEGKPPRRRYSGRTEV
jgi:hypothetical protein